MGLSNRQIKALKKNAVYKIDHERKGVFIGQFIGYDDEAARVGDKIDNVFLTFKYDVRVGTAQANLSTGVKLEGGGMAPVRVSNLRPSLIESLTQTQEQEWLLKVKVVEAIKPKQEPGWLDKLLGRKE